jgi:hypothetical protein
MGITDTGRYRTIMAWQTIDNAPKDGSHLLLWDSQYKQAVIAMWEKGLGGAWVEPNAEMWEPLIVTHWMPLPNPPE